MSVRTVRDECWHEVLLLITEEGRFKISDLPFDEGQRHTVRRVLKVMQEYGWLTRDPPDSGRIWYAGDLAKDKLQLKSRAELLADPDFEV